MHSRKDRDALLEAYRAKDNLERKRARRARSRADSDATADAIGDLLGGAGGGGGSDTWRQFEAVGAVLHQFGALEDWEASAFGELVAELGGDNELWLALVMLERAYLPTPDLPMTFHDLP